MGIFGGPTNEAMGVGLRVPSTSAKPDPATRMGLGGIQGTEADTAVLGRPVPSAALQRLEAAIALPGAPPAAQAKPRATVYFNETTNEMYAGDQAFKADDATAAMQAAQRPRNTTRPEGQGWTSLPESSFESYLSSFSQPRGLLGDLGIGAQNVGESLIGGTGRGLQLLGAENVGRSIADFADEYIGTSESQDTRSALIAAEQGFGGKVLTGVQQSAPSMATSIGAGIAGASIGGKLGLPFGPGGVAAGAFLGSIAGVAASILPMEIYASWEAAEQNGLSTDDNEVRADIITSSILKTGAQTVGPAVLVRGISPAFRKVVSDTTRRTMSSRIKYGLGTGALEGSAEAIAGIVDKVMFDPELRAVLSSDDRTILAPLVLDRYGEEVALDFFVGAALGGGIGVLTGPAKTRPQPQLDVEGGDPVNMLNGANLYGQVSPINLQIGYTPGSPTIGTIPLPGEAMDLPKTAAGANVKPLTLGQMALQRAGTGGLRPEDRQSGNVRTPGGDRKDALTGEILDPIQPGRARLLGIPQDPNYVPTQALPPGTESAADFGVDPAGVATPTGVPPTGAPITPVTEPVVTAVPLTKKQKAAAERAEKAAKKAADDLAAAEAAAPVTPPPATDQGEAGPTSAAARGIVAGMTGLGEGGKKAGRERVANLIRTAGSVTYRTPDAIAVAKADPSQMTVDNPDGSLTVTGIQVEPGGPWVGTSPAPAPGKKRVAASGKKSPKKADLDTTQRDLDEFIARGKEEQRQKLAAFPKAREFPEVARFLSGFLGSGSEGMRNISNELADYTAWLGARTDAEWAKIGEAFRSGDNPYLAAGALGGDPKTLSAKIAEFDALINPDTTPPPTTTSTEKAPGKSRVRSTAAESAAKRRAAAGGLRTKSEAPPPVDTTPPPAPPPPVDTTPPADTTPPPAPPTATQSVVVKGSKRAPKGVSPHFTITLSDVDGENEQVVRIKHVKETGAWTFMKTDAVIGTGLTSKTAADKVAELASAGTLPEGVVDTEQDVVEPEKKLTAAQQLEAEVESTIDALDSETDKKVRGAAISTLVEMRADQSATPELRTRVDDYLASLGDEVSAGDLSDATGADTDTVRLSNMIADFLDAPGPVLKKWTDEFKRLAKSVKATDPKATFGDSGPLLTSFIKTNGDVDMAKLRSGGFSLADWNTIDNVVDLDGKPITRIAAGRVQLIARNFMSKLARPPKLTVVRNQADLKARFPKLHAQAVAARPEGDFDSANAAGYSFGDGEVIIFSDRIASEQHLQFVLAHETLGHYGLRGIMPGPKFDTLMEMVYDTDERVARAADAAISVRPGLSRAEAVEEYLSDYAAMLDTSIVAKIWNSIKGFLNKVGIKTGDEMMRYLLDQSRRYARYGTGVTFDAQAVAQRLNYVESSGDTGRFAPGRSLRDVNIEIGLQRDTLSELPTSVNEAWDYLKGFNIDTVDALDRFKAQFLSLSHFRARNNPGAAAFEESLKDARDHAMSIKVKYDELMQPALSRAIYGTIGGISDAQRSTVSNMLVSGLRRGAKRYTDADGNLGNVPLFRIVGNKLVPNTAEIARLQSNGTVSLEDMRDGFDYVVEFAEGGKIVKKKEKFAGVPGLTKDSIEWKSYKSIREAMDGVELELLEAHYQSLMDNRDLMFRKLAQVVPDKKLNADERAVLTTLAKTYGDLYTMDAAVSESGGAKLDPDHKTYANDILKAANAALIGEKEDRFVALRKLLVEPREFTKSEEDGDIRRTLPAAMSQQIADDTIAKLQAFRKRANLSGDKYAVQNKIKQIITAEVANQDADKYAKRSLFTGYVPILRGGKFQMRVEVIVNDKPVRVKDEYRQQMVYSQFDKLSEAVGMSEIANKAFGDDTFEVMYYDDSVKKYVLGQATLRARAETALETVAAPPDVNLNEFMRGIQLFDINLTPQKLEQLIVALTKQNSAARNRLARAFTPGADLDSIRAASQHIESRASTIAKVRTRVRQSELMDRSMGTSNDLWNAEVKDPDTGRDWLEVLKERADAAAANKSLSKEMKADAQREYEAYAYMVKQTRTGTVNKANQFYGESARTMAFVDGNRNLDESDFGAKPFVAGIRSSTAMIQLGGSMAHGAMNFLALETNVVPYLSTYNKKTAFGGGFGLGKVHKELLRALAQVGGPGILDGQFHTAGFYAKIEADPAMQKQYGLSATDARFLKEGIQEGKLSPAQSNSLVGTSRGRVTRGITQKGIDGWMWTFNMSERASRQGAGLAAYRLEFARRRATGKSEEDAHELAKRFSLLALDYTLGDYAVLARPPAWRSGIASFAYMYKVFVTTSVQLLANMDRSGQAWMLASLFILTGVAGLPFAENLEDLIDTIAQTLGIPGWQGARYEAAKVVDEAFPGMTPIFLQGLVNQFVPGDVAAKTSLGRLFPATDIFLAGADPMRGVMEIFGPAAGMVAATGVFAKAALTAPFTAKVDAKDVLREAPVTMIRAWADAAAYLENGAVIDRRGYVVSPDMNAGIVLARAVGFYPTSASREYDGVRMAKRVTDYQREQVTSYRTGWILAMQEGDRERAREIEKEVENWNKGSKNTGLVIKDFVKNSRRALKEANRPVMERTLRSAPDVAENDLRTMADLLTLN